MNEKENDFVEVDGKLGLWRGDEKYISSMNDVNDEIGVVQCGGLTMKVNHAPEGKYRLIYFDGDGDEIGWSTAQLEPYGDGWKIEPIIGPWEGWEPDDTNVGLTDEEWVDAFCKLGEAAHEEDGYDARTAALNGRVVTHPYCTPCWFVVDGRKYFTMHEENGDGKIYDAETMKEVDGINEDDATDVELGCCRDCPFLQECSWDGLDEEWSEEE